MKKNTIIDILYDLSKKSNGKAKELFDFFSLSKDDYCSLIPLSPVQKDMYLESLITNTNSLYNVAIYILFEGELDIKLWEKAREYHYESNSLERAKIVEKDGAIFFALKNKYDRKLIYNDISNEKLSKEQLKEYVKNLVKKENYVTQEFLLDDFVIKHDENKYIFGITGSHIANDGLGAMLKLKRFEMLYKELKHEKTLPLIDDSAAINYIFESKKQFNEAETLSFWKDKLQNLSPVLMTSELKDDFSKNCLKSLKIEKDHLKDIRDFCWQNKLTVSLYFKAIFAILSKFYFKTTNDFIIFEFISGRKHELNSLPGMYASSIPIPVKNDFFNEDFNHLIRCFKLLKKEYRKHQFISNGEVNKLLPDNTLTLLYNYLPKEFTKTELLNDVYHAIRIDKQSPDDVQFTVEEFEDSLNIILYYNEDNFKENHFLDRILLLSRQISENNVNQISDLDYLEHNESETILNLFNNNKVDFPFDRMFIDLFEEQVQKSENKIAVKFLDKELSYSELNAKANQLANLINEKYSIDNEMLIGIYMNRSDIMLISILAIFKLGAAYVPLNTEDPINRTETIFEDAEIKLVLSDNKNITKLNGVVDTLSSELLLENENSGNDNLVRKRNTKDLAYVIYTSGSTGKPKGVMVEQIGMLNHLFLKIQDLKMNDQSIVSQNASHCFDISVWQFLSSLLLGGKTVIYPNDLILNVESFIDEIENDKISILELVPSYLALVIDFIKSRKTELFKNINYLLVTGEELKFHLVKEWLQIKPLIPIVNAYGPTEASDDITHCLIDQIPNNLEIPIGKPVSNMNIYIVDETMNLCPIGMKGEICVSGIGVGRGYINNSEKTNAAFVKNPFSKEGFALYKTGDIGAWREDGSILFYGRKDHQIKIRGFRVELGEIETQILKFPNIKNAVVIDYEDNDKNKQLVAYLIANINVDELRLFLNKQLPDYMIPSNFIILDEFPINTNGKIDRKKLPKPEQLQKEHTIPRTKLETEIYQVWSEVLKNNSFGINDNYFQLGGDSILSIRINALLKKRDIQIEIRDIYQYPTVSKLAERYESLKAKENKIEIAFWSKENTKKTILYKEISVKSFDELEEKLRSFANEHIILNSTITDEKQTFFLTFLESNNFSVTKKDFSETDYSEEILSQQISKDSKVFDTENSLSRFYIYHFSNKDLFVLMLNDQLVDSDKRKKLVQDLDKIIENNNSYTANHKNVVNRYKEIFKSLESSEKEINTYQNNHELMLKAVAEKRVERDCATSLEIHKESVESLEKQVLPIYKSTIKELIEYCILDIVIKAKNDVIIYDRIGENSHKNNSEENLTLINLESPAFITLKQNNDIESYIKSLTEKKNNLVQSLSEIDLDSSLIISVREILSAETAWSEILEDHILNLVDILVDFKMTESNSIDLEINYNSVLLNSVTEKDFLEAITANIEKLIQFGNEKSSKEILPSDIDYKGFTSDQLDNFLEQITSKD